MSESHVLWGHDAAATGDTASAFFGIGRHVRDESKTEDRAVVVGGGHAEFRFTGHAVGVVISPNSPQLKVNAPASRGEQAAYATWVMATLVAGGWIGDHVHDPLVGAVTGFWYGTRLWNRWARQRP